MIEGSLPFVTSLLEAKSIIIVGWFLVVFLLERFLVRKARLPGSFRHFLHNILLFTLIIFLSPFLVIYMRLATEGVFNWRPDFWSGGRALILDLILLDLIIYWWHRLNHELPILWRFHEVHHLDEAMDSTTALRFHFGEVVLSALFRSGFAILLDIPIATVILAEAIILLAAIFHHANFSFPPRGEAILSKIIITPGLHWTHHEARQRDTDSNYGNLLAIWDMLFRSRNVKETHDARIGVEGKREPSFGILLWSPFRLSRRK